MSGGALRVRESEGYPVIEPTTKPHLELVLPLVEEATERYEDIAFVFSNSRLRDMGTLAPNFDTYHGAAFTALGKGYPDLAELSFGKAKEKFTKLRSYMNGAVVIKSGSEPMPRQRLLPWEDEFEAVIFDLAEQNHPAIQMLIQLEDQYPELPSYVIPSVAEHLVASLENERIRADYKRAVSLAKSQV